MRARLFAEHPWCIECLKQGRKTRATIRDHIIPLAEGGADDETNEQPLCLDCSDAKTEEESKRGVERSGLRGDRFRQRATPRDETGRFRVRRRWWKT